MTDIDFATVLSQRVKQAGCPIARIARLTGVPRETIVNWLRGTVKKPRNWRNLAQVARVLHLNETEASELLQSAGYPSIEELLKQAGDCEDHGALSPWADAVRQRLNQAPFQAIADFPHFVGRQRELQALKEALLNGDQVMLYSFQGMGGVGKTTLAARIAYELRPHFPDGVLWARVDMSDTMSILGAFASAYGCDVSMHTDVESRSQVVRGLLADKQALIVLDNVQSSEQASPLLPPSGTCAVIVTTRRHDLSVTRAAHRFLISPFREETGESLDLFAKILGRNVTGRESPTLTEMADLLGHLPLALDIAASRMAYEPGWSASSFLARLYQERNRLNELAYEDQSVRLSFNVSYEALSVEQQRFFAALGVFGGEDFSIEAVAYTTMTPYQEAEDLLRVLHNLSLIQQRRSGRYQLHPLLRDYAREKGCSDDVYERMITYFVCYTELHKRDYAVLDLEESNIVAALEAMYEREKQAELVRCANAFYHFLDVRGLYMLAEVHLTRAAQAARAKASEKSGDTSGLAVTLSNLGWTALRRGDYDRAEGFHREGLEMARRSEDGESISAILRGLGLGAWYRGDCAQAEMFWQQGLAIAREIGDRREEGRYLCNLGTIYRDLGQAEQAIEHYEQGLAIAREIGDRRDEGRNLGNLGIVYHISGQVERAIELHKQALAAFRDIGDRSGEAADLGNLGGAYGDLGQAERAIEYYGQALAIAREIGSRQGEGTDLGNLGNAYSDLGQAERAVEHYEQALAIAREIGNRRREGVWLGKLGNTYRDQEQVERAIEHYEQALAVAREIGDRQLEGELMSEMGKACSDLGQVKRAIEHCERALAIAREISDRRGEGYYLCNLGAVYRDLGQVERAIEHYERALAIAREIGDRRNEGRNLDNLGIVYQRSGQVERAIKLHEQALATFRDIGDRSGEATGLGNLGGAYGALGQAERAIEHYEQALVIARGIGNRQLEGDIVGKLGER
jgi:tetratricopeptide (TPR) repeat protein/transcriptional regulator with XRE-family HTH domain